MRYLDCSCSGGLNVETTSHYFFTVLCSVFLGWCALLKIINKTCSAISDKSGQLSLASCFMTITLSLSKIIWTRLLVLKCSYWFCSFYEKYWWTTLSSLIYRMICLFLFYDYTFESLFYLKLLHFLFLAPI